MTSEDKKCVINNPMKKIIVFMILLLVTLTGKSQEDSIYAIVSNDTVTLWHTQTERNCNASYQMLVDLYEYHMTWLESDTGDMVHCSCYFDLSVTYGPLGPGTYSVDVYHTERWEMDTVYDGNTTFIIEESMSSEPSEVVQSWVSDCYEFVGVMDDPVIIPVGQNFPNPFSDRTTIPSKLTDHSISYLLIMNMLGEVVRVLEFKPDTAQIIWDGTDDNGNTLPSGIYYYGSSIYGHEGFRKMMFIR